MMRTTVSLFTLLVLLTAAPKAQAGGVADRYQASYDHEARSDYAAALLAMAELPAKQQRSYVFNYRQGWLLYLASRHEESLLAYGRAAALEKRSVEARVALLLPLMALRRWQDALTAAEDALALDPHNFLGASRRAYILYNLGRYQQAEKAYGSVLRFYPSDVEMRAGLGWSLLKQGKAAAAKVQFLAVLTIAPRHIVAGEGFRAVE